MKMLGISILEGLAALGAKIPLKVEFPKCSKEISAMRRSNRLEFVCLLAFGFIFSLSCSSAPPPEKPPKAVKTVAFIEVLTRDDADAIAISAINPAEQVKSINKAAKRAIVITQDSDAPESDRLLYIGADNVAAGRQAGELMKKADGQQR
jgi:hypothetical protein